MSDLDVYNEAFSDARHNRTLGRLRRIEQIREVIISHANLLPSDPSRYELVKGLVVDMVKQAQLRPDVKSPDQIADAYEALGAHPEELRAVLIEEVSRTLRSCPNFFGAVDLLASINNGRADLLKLFKGGCDDLR